MNTNENPPFSLAVRFNSQDKPATTPSMDIQLDNLREQWKHLASWENLNHSISAVVGINALCLYLMFTDATKLNLTVYAILLLYISIYGQWIWKSTQHHLGWGKQKTTEEEEEETRSASTSEVSFMIEETKSKFYVLKKFRSDTPGLFCLSLSSFFFFISFIAPYLTLVTCIWLTLMGGLMLPLGMKLLKDKYPQISDILSKAQNMLIVILKDLIAKASVQIQKGIVVGQEKGKIALRAAEVNAAMAKVSILKYISKEKETDADDKSAAPKEDESSFNREKDELAQKESELSQEKDINGNLQQISV